MVWVVLYVIRLNVSYIFIRCYKPGNNVYLRYRDGMQRVKTKTGEQQKRRQKSFAAEGTSCTQK